MTAKDTFTLDSLGLGLGATGLIVFAIMLIEWV